MKKCTYQEIKEFVENLGYELISKEYKNNRSKLILKDYNGYYYIIKSNSLQQGYKPMKFHKSNPYTIQNIKLWLKLNNKPFELLSDTYINAKENLKWKCLKEECGEFLNISLNGYGCGYCAGRQVGISNCLATKFPDIATEWHPRKNGDLTPWDVTHGSGKHVWWQCNKNHKHEWYVSINSRTNSNNGCPYCSGQLPSEDYNLLVINPELCKEWDYEKNIKKPEEYCPNSGKKVWWKSKECGHEWKTYISSRNSKPHTGCPECAESKGEKKISLILINNNWIKISQQEFEQLIDKNKYNKKYLIPQKKFNGLVGVGNKKLSYDFYIPKYNLLVEYHGEQHERYIPGIFHKSIKDFEKQIEHDRRKCEYAHNNNISLLIIWYWDFDNIEEILEKELN